MIELDKGLHRIVSVCHGVSPMGGLMTDMHGYCGRCHRWARFVRPLPTNVRAALPGQEHADAS